MKKIITISLLSIFAITTSIAQLGKGTYLLGATQDITSTSWTDISISPSVGYFLTDEIAVGLGFSYSSNDDNQDITMGGQTVTTSMSFSPFLRYYLNDMLFATGGFGLNSGTTTFKQEGESDAESSNSGFGLNLGAGLSLMWGERVAVEPALLLTTSSSSTKTANVTVDGPSSVGLGFSIGLSLRM